MKQTLCLYGVRGILFVLTVVTEHWRVVWNERGELSRKIIEDETFGGDGYMRQNVVRMRRKKE